MALRISRREGLAFGGSLAGGFALIAAIMWWRANDRLAAVFAAAAGVSLVAALVVPERLGPVRDRWMWMGEQIGRVTTPAMLALIYFLVVTPLGVLRRVVTRREVDRSTLWKVAEHDRSRARLERQF